MMAAGCPLVITQSVTGDCQNNSSGGFSLDITGVFPYTLEWLDPNGNPNTSVQFEGIKLGYYEINGLPAGTYSFTITDSCGSPGPQTQSVNITITSDTCVSIESADTFCGLDNGSITATTSIFYGQGYFDLYRNDVYYTGTTGSTNPVYFNNLEEGIYYVVANNGGGCTGRSENCIVMSSSTLEYGLYIVNDGNCTGRIDQGTGKIYVTGLTGNGPFTYSWNDVNKSTTSYITGLTAGFYSVTVTDFLGCVSTQVAQIQSVPTMGLISSLVVPPTCYGNDGEITITISGGSAPYYYLNNNTGEVQISFNQSVTYTNLAAGVYNFTVTDAGLCTFTTNVTLLTPTIFNVLSVNSKNATCQSSNGSISILLNGGTQPYRYKLITSQSFTLIDVSSQSPNYVFSNLSADTYTLIITDANNSCNYQQFVTIAGTANFSVSASATQPLCGNNNGSVTVTKTPGGSGIFVYSLNDVYFSPQTISNSHTFNNLPQGFYNVKVIDSTGCTQTTGINIVNSTPLNFFLSKTDINISNDGTINVYITEGNPPFTINWSNNVNGQTGLTLNSLSAGTYSVTIVDNSGCSKTSEVTIVGRNFIGNFQVFNICNGTLIDQGIPQRQGIQQMLAEGYFDLSKGNIGCILDEAKMTAIVKVNNTEVSSQFYTSTSLSDVPSDSLWAETITNLLKGIYGIGNVSVNISQNSIIITTNCNIPENVLSDATVTVDLKIDYGIKCISCEPGFQVFTACCDGSYWLVASAVGNFNVGDTILTTGGCMSFVVVDTSQITISGIVDNETFVGGQYVNCGACLSVNPNCTLTPTPTQTQTPTPTPNATPPVTPSVTPTMTVTPTQTSTPGLSPSITPTQTPTKTPNLTLSPTPTKTQTPTRASGTLFNQFFIGSYNCDTNFVQFVPVQTITFWVSPTANIYNTSSPFQLYLNQQLSFPFTVSSTDAPLYMRIGNNIWSINQSGVATYLTSVGASCLSGS